MWAIYTVCMVVTGIWSLFNIKIGGILLVIICVPRIFVLIILIEKSMSDIGIGTRTNGYGGIGVALKGNFKSDNLGKTLLFVQSKSSPTIKIERTDKKDVYISFCNSESTEQLYREMIANIPLK